MPEELWMEVQNIVQQVVTRTIPKKKKGGACVAYVKWTPARKILGGGWTRGVSF